ncbi:MAG: hydroxyphenylacetyl-CoA thioesterase PaaI [Rhodospirillales bacterium]
MNEPGPMETTPAAAETDDHAIARRAGAAMYANDLASQHLGIVLDDIRPGYARMRMTVGAQMLNGHAICHGGYVFLLADTAFAFACNSYNRTTVAASAAVEFLAPCYLNDVLTAVAEEQVRGARLGVYDIVITNQNGQRIALFRGRSYRVQGTIVAEDRAEAPTTSRSAP